MPVLHKTSGMPFGAWFNDQGDGNVTKVFFMDHYYKERNVRQFNSTHDFVKDKVCKQVSYRVTPITPFFRLILFI